MSQPWRLYLNLIRAEAAPDPPQLASPWAAPLIGRSRQWHDLISAWETASAGQPLLTVLVGEAGAGKTRLAEELVGWALRQGTVAAMGRCYAAEGELPYGPVTQWLRSEPVRRAASRLEPHWLAEAARLVPEWGPRRPGQPEASPVREPWQKRRLFEGLVRAVTAGNPALLVLDDLHWCDLDTLQWLYYLLRQDHRSRILVLATARPDELDDRRELSILRTALMRREQWREIPIERLNPTDTALLGASVSGRPMDPDTAGALFRETAGNPLFIIETVRAGSSPRGIPLSIQTVVSARLTQLSPWARELCELCAVIGHRITIPVLAPALGRSEICLVEPLEELRRRHILQEDGPDAYSFSHDKVREVAYAGLSAARRSLLHRRVGEALADGIRELAVEYGLRATREARRIGAHEEASRHYRRALALSESAPVAAHTLVDLWKGLGEAEIFRANHEEARAALRAALGLLPAEDEVRRSRLLLSVATTWAVQRRFDEAEAAIRQAEQALGSPRENGAWGRASLQVRLDVMWLFYWSARPDPMAAVAQEIAIAVTETGTPEQQVRFYQALALINVRREEYMLSAETVRLARLALETAQKLKVSEEEPFAHFAVGFCLLFHGDSIRAAEQLRLALALAERTGDVVLQCRCLNYLAVTARTEGDEAQARTLALRTEQMALRLDLLEYAAMARATLAWVHWRAGDVDQTVSTALSALDTWSSPEVHSLQTPFEGYAIWPLLAVAAHRGSTDAVMPQVERLLEPKRRALTPPSPGMRGLSSASWRRAPTSQHRSDSPSVSLPGQPLCCIWQF